MAKLLPATSSLTENVSMEWNKEAGEILTDEFEGEFNEVLARYNLEKAAASSFGTPNLASLGFNANRGRAQLVRRFVRENNSIEELYAVDVIRDIRENSYFADLTTTQILSVNAVVDAATGDTPSEWNALQTTLYNHLVHGASSYIDKQFVLRVSRFVSLAATLELDMSSVGTVAETAPVLSEDMWRLIKTLPEGEWLQGPITVENLGSGRFRVDTELQWADRWSVVYGGTLFA